jgi:hypothetical protein
VEHLPERFALLVILVLGEAVGGTARGVHDASWAPIAIAVGALAFAIAQLSADPAESSGRVSDARYDLSSTATSH